MMPELKGRNIMENKSFGLVSIIMPLYNCEQYIAKSIESVINQTYSDWELLIVDDCSTDKSVEVVKSFTDKRIKLLSNEHNSGAALSRNYALREAKGKWIAFLDSDDMWLPTKLEEQLQFMNENNYSFTYTDYQVCINDEFEQYIRTAPDYVNFRRIKRYCYFFTSTVLYDAEKVGLIQIGDIKKNNDYAMWLKALKNVTAYRFPKLLSYYVRHQNSISSGSKLKLIKWHYRLFKNECGYNGFHSVLLTIGNLWHGFWKKIIYKKKIRPAKAEK